MVSHYICINKRKNFDKPLPHVLSADAPVPRIIQPRMYGDGVIYIFMWPFHLIEKWVRINVNGVYAFAK